jgi:hypothetical protein
MTLVSKILIIVDHLRPFLPLLNGRKFAQKIGAHDTEGCSVK